MKTSLTPFHMLLLFLTILCWSGYYVAGRFALDAFPPFFVTFLRFALLAIVLLPFFGWPKIPFWQIAVLSLLLGVMNFGLGLAALGWGLDIPSTIVVSQLSVPLSCVFGAILLGDRLGKWQSSGLAVAMLGAVFIAGTPNVSSHFGAFLTMLLASASWGLANILMKKFGEMKIMPFLGALSLLSAIPLLVLSMVFETGQMEALQTIGWREGFGILYLTFAATLGAYALWYFLLHRYLASQITPVTMLTPFLSFTLAWIFLGQGISLQVAIAGAITMAGVAMITFRQPRIAMLGKIGLIRRKRPKAAE